MTDYRLTQPPRPRGLRTGLVLVLAVLAFVAGLALAVYAMKRLPWFAVRPVAVVAPPAAPPIAALATPQVDTQALATRATVLAGQLAGLEARTAAITADAQAAGMQAGRAESLLVAFAARRALDRGLALGYLEGQLHARFDATQPRAVAYIIQAARSPLTLGDLREGLAAIGPDIANDTQGGWLAGLRDEVSTLVVLRRGNSPSPLPEDRLDRARQLLEGGQVEAARAEVARLPGAAQATNWMTAARRFVTARHALDLLEAAALQTPVAAPAPVVPSVPQTAAPATPVNTGTTEVPDWAK